MSTVTTLRDKHILETYLRRCPHLNYYHLGDLDDFFWPDTRWYAFCDGEEIEAVALLYTAPKPVVLLAILNDNESQMNALLADLVLELPPSVYAHLSPGLEALFADRYDLRHNGEHYKMTLADPAKLAPYGQDGLVVLGESDLSRINRLYRQAYPDNWFDPRMLQSGQYLGLPGEDGELLCIAGVHVYSPQYGVAALGNITTRPAARGQGLATRVTAALCQRLLQNVDVIGLNVRTDNPAAVRTYRKIGFEVAGVYNEWMMVGK